MKPIRLSMKAFGSFAQETAVDFTVFQNGLFLVVGETGAGKTTVFDAIVFALFGKASGSSRDSAMMHSDYVEKSEDTAVELVFEQQGRRYTVRRTIHFPRKRAAEGGYGEASLNAEMRLPDGSAVSGHAAVSKRCEELLGLNADQFRKIVMLAQGEFREFLTADSAKKSEILGKLFDSSAYLRYQKLLGDTRKLLEDQRNKLEDTVKSVMRGGFEPPADDPETVLKYLPGNPQLIENLDRLIADEREQEQELGIQKQQAQQAVAALQTKLGAARGDNEKLNELQKLTGHWIALEEQREEMERSEREFMRAEAALHRVYPLRENFSRAQTAVSDAGRRMEDLQDRLRTSDKKREQAQTSVNEDEQYREPVRQLETEAGKLQESLPQYDTLDAKQAALYKALQVAKTKKDAHDRSETQKEALEKQLQEHRQELEGLADAEAEQVRRQELHTRAENALREWSGDGGITERTKAILQAEAAVKEREDELLAYRKAAGEAEDYHHRLYQAFIGGQAGLLAQELEQELAKNGQAVCPVCGSAFHSGEPHRFADRPEDTPTQPEVDAAKRAYEEAEKARADLDQDIQTRQARIGEQKKSLQKDAEKLLPDGAAWEQLSAPGVLEAVTERLEKEEKAAADALNEAKQRAERKNQLETACRVEREAVESLTTELEAETQMLAQEDNRIAGLKAEVQTLQNALPYASKGEAEVRIKQLRGECARWNERFDANRNALTAARDEHSGLQGQLKAQEDALPALKAALVNAKESFAAGLAQNGFADDAELDAALRMLGTADPEKRLKQWQNDLNDYRNRCSNTAERLEDLTRQTKDLQVTDMEALQNRLKEVQDALDQAGRAETDLTARRKNHEKVRKQVSDALTERRQTDALWERLDRLAELAVGASGDGGKLSFERYVMGALFREVLEMADRRLDVMSGGRYQLVHTTSVGRANSAAGLEIEVLDLVTGKQRPVGSLSGGESFQVSLSLALGLSDVVQSHAGGIGLDTMFIDEGFGTLDSGALDNALKVLDQLAEGSRLVGIISHVDRLEESIPQRIRVSKTAGGSRLETEC